MGLDDDEVVSAMEMRKITTRGSLNPLPIYV